MKYVIFLTIIFISYNVSHAYINETYDCKMKNFIGIDKDGMPKKWREQRFSFKWKDDFTIQTFKAVEEADLVFFVTDYSSGILPYDFELSSVLRKTKKNVIESNKFC